MGYGISWAGDNRNNVFHGGYDDDTIYGKGGQDRLFGGYGNDHISGGDDSDWLYGEHGEDVLDGGSGDDHLYGGSDNDTLDGGDGWDHLFGGGGNDILDGGVGNDELNGGPGVNVLFGGAGFDTDTVNYEDASEDPLAIQKGRGKGGVYVDLADGTATGQYYNEQSGSNEDFLDLLSSIENVIGSRYDDILIGDDGANVLAGQDGDDDIRGGAGGDRLDGGEGSNDIARYWDSGAAVTVDLATGLGSGGFASDDTLIDIECVEGSNFGDFLFGDNKENWLYGGAGDDVLNGRAGVDHLFGDEGNDGLDGGRGDDSLSGGVGDDTLEGGEGVDWLLGDDGNDILEGGAGDDRILGGGGIDALSYKGSNAGVTIDVAARTASGGDAEGDVFDQIENVTGSGHNDFIWGDGSSNTLDGGAGSDQLYGRGGDDWLIGGRGADYLDGGPGSGDTASYATSGAGVTINLAAHTASGGDATDDTLLSIEYIEGSGFDDSITGNAENNALAGRDGSDILDGGAGADWLFGDDGHDILIGGADGDHLIGGDGIDTLSYEGSYAGVTIDLAALTASGGDAQGDVFGEIENVMGSSFDDVIMGDAGSNTLDGAGGADTLRGGAGDDSLLGGAGNDWLAGGPGNDELTGGADNDTFYFGSAVGFGAAFGNDKITDFGKGAGDVIALDVPNFQTLDDILAISTQNGADTVIQFDANNSITLEGVQVTDLHTSDFLFL